MTAKALKRYTATEGAIATPTSMLDRAVHSGARVEVIERLMGLQERYENTQAVKAYNAAIAEARAEIPVILKTNAKTGAGGSYKYESLADIATIVDPILAKHGLSYRYKSESNAELLKVSCVITHALGHSEENSLSAKPNKFGSSMNDIQALGSAVTYLQRYTLKLALGIATSKDTDGSPEPRRTQYVERGTGGPPVQIDAETGEIIEDALITPTEAEKLAIDITNAGANYTKFMQYLGVEVISDIKQSQLPRAYAALDSKKRSAQ
ncbi:MAG: ERF family protein [Gammaproteobacteria bacterium]